MFIPYALKGGEPMSARAARTRLFTVFETIDDARREVFVGMSPEPSPRGRVIESRLEETDARDFIRLYVKTRLPAGWRFRI